MKVEKTQLVSIKLKGHDAATIADIFTKLAAAKNTVGFTKSPFNDAELKLIDKVSKGLKT